MLKKLASPDACILTALKGNCFYACRGDAEGGMGWSPALGARQRIVPATLGKPPPPSSEPAPLLHQLSL